MMNYFQPKFANNELVPLPIQLRGFNINCIWPLQEHAKVLQRSLQIFGITCILISYVAVVVAEISFVKVNLNKISSVIEAITFMIISIQYFMRIILLRLRQRRMREFIDHFYKEIYFTSADDRILLAKITKTMRIIGVITLLYCMPMVLKCISLSIQLAHINIRSQTKPYMLPFVFEWYDAQAPVAYVITMLYTGFHPISFFSLRAAEDYFLCLILLHTSYRYIALQEELRGMLSVSFMEAKRLGEGLDGVQAIFRKRLSNVFQKQQRLDIFVNSVKSYLSYHVFYSISFGVALLCVGCFRLEMVAFDEESMRFLSFCFSQAMQILMLGHFGQILLNQTNAMHESYYMCEWELVLKHGGTHSNKALMNDIKLAIMRAEHGAVIVGMKTFPLTHTTVLWSLRNAASYFMFLKTVNER